MITVPCKGCTKRQMNCHSTCEDYIQYKIEVGELNHNKSKYLNEGYAYKDSIQRSNKRK